MKFSCAIKKTITISFAMAVVAVAGALTTSAYDLNNPTQQEIIDRFNQYPFTTSGGSVYTEEYSLTSPYEKGEIAYDEQTEALNAVNFCRFVAGLPADLQIKDEFIEMCQAGSLVNAVNDLLSHTPTQPAGMSTDLYNLGYSGTSHSNIAMGYENIPGTIFGYMDDSDTRNIEVVGHRRWILNPKMLYTGFGNVTKYSGMYAHDFSRTQNFTGDYICWPAKNMPYEIYDSVFAKTYAFSCTLGNAYDEPSLANVKVKVTSSKLGKSWDIDSTCQDMSGVYLNVDNQNYGMKKCIIFSVGEKFPEDDKITVTITGIKKYGFEKTITYNVQMFNMFENHGFKEEYSLYEGDTLCISTVNPIDANMYKWSYMVTGCLDIKFTPSYVEVKGLKAGATKMFATKSNDGTKYNFVVNVLPRPDDVQYQLVDKGNGIYGLRFLLTANESDVLNVDKLQLYYNVPQFGNTKTFDISKAYKSVIEDGKTTAAGSGKVFVIGNNLEMPEEYLNGVTAYFKLGEKTYSTVVEH
ncbi:MAG: CAP domain-containing protein [Ruminococcus sp.]|nr:CAP domain-containing protein [Ruminococcus sp.]